MRELTLLYLYPRSMNTYGDRGNILALQKRCEWMGINVLIHTVEVGEEYDFTKADIVFAGGGQDSNQMRIADDLVQKKKTICRAVDEDVIFLTICGTYQLFGNYFTTHEKKRIEGISVFDCITEASSIRKIGNVVVEHFIDGLTPKTLVGFENHSGNTLINKKNNFNDYKTETVPLGKVISGFGNNGTDGFEGARYKNCFGTYLHGSLLPKNPHFADHLIGLALRRKYGNEVELKELDDNLEMKAHLHILNK